MVSKIHLRMSCYVGTFTMHAVNLTLMQMIKKEDIPTDTNLKIFRSMIFRYFTCWTVLLQIFYAALALYCDTQTLKNSNNNKFKLPKFLSSTRNIVFAALVWPSSMVVFTVFWSLYVYDRSLIFPEFIDKIISPTCNHILHTAIVPIALWEVIFRERMQPRSHLRNIAHLLIHVLLYLFVLYYTYATEGHWLYPVFHVTYGSINFFFLHIVLGALFLIFYYMQWYLNNIIHGQGKKMKN